MISEYQVLRDIDKRIADLQNTQDNGLIGLRSEFRLFRQETHFYRANILDRLAKLEEKASKPLIDWNGLLQKLWVQLIILAAFATGNKQLIELVKAAFGG